MPSINTSNIIRASDSTYFVDIARVKKFILTYLLTYNRINDLNKTKSNSPFPGDSDSASHETFLANTGL